MSSKDTRYFSHDSNAFNDPKIVALVDVYGMEGYGRYWRILEMMRESEDYKIEIKGKYFWNSMKRLLLCKCSASAEQFINDCIHEFELFESDDEFFWSESLLKRMDKMDSIKEKRREAAKKRWKNANASKSDANASKSDAKKCKGNKIKGKEIKEKESKACNTRAREDSGQENFDSENSNLNEINETENENGREVSKSFEIIESPIKKMREAWEQYAHNIAWNKFEIQALNEIFKSYKAIGARDPAEQFAQDIQSRPEYLNEKGRLTPGYWARNFNSIHTEIHKSQNNEAGKSRKGTHQIYDEQTADELAEQLAADYRNAQ